MPNSPDTNAQQIEYWNEQAGPRWVAGQEALDEWIEPYLGRPACEFIVVSLWIADTDASRRALALAPNLEGLHPEVQALEQVARVEFDRPLQ